MSEINIFDTEKLVHEAKMSYGNMDEMLARITVLGERLTAMELAYQSFAEACMELIDKEQSDRIIQMANQKTADYLYRYTDEETKKKLVELGYPDMCGVVVNGVFGDEAIEHGYEVYAIKQGEVLLLEHCQEASRKEEEGYTLVVKPFVYEAEFFNGLDS